MIALRLTLFSIGLIGAILISPWVVGVCMLLLSLRWRAIEAIALGLTIDLLWLPPGSWPLFTIGAIAVVWLLEPLRRELLA